MCSRILTLCSLSVFLSVSAGYPYEESIRVPLVIMDPRMPETVRNTRNDEFTLNIDLAPTLLSAAGIPVPSVMQGRDIAALYLDGDNNNNGGDDSSTTKSAARAGWRKEFYYEWFTGDPVALPSSLALVRKNLKYILWPQHDNTEELYLLEEDPHEETNLLTTNNATTARRSSSLSSSSSSSLPQTSRELLDAVRERFRELKATAESGVKI